MSQNQIVMTSLQNFVRPDCRDSVEALGRVNAVGDLLLFHTSVVHKISYISLDVNNR